MPYYVFKVKPFAQIERLAVYDKFRDASTHAKALRAGLAAADGRIKVMFADSEQLAEDLLCQIRDPGPSGDE